MQRYGMTIPFSGTPLHEQRELFEELVAHGYTDLWSAEANTTDAFTPLALAVGFAMIASYFLSSTLVPILSVWLLRPGKVHGDESCPK